jgi:hypothetical protein
MFKRAAFLAFALCVGCYQVPGEDPGADGPGTEAWGSASVICDTDGDCNANEMCQENVCQAKMCTNGPYSSAPPIGKTFLFSRDRELLVGSGSTIDGHEPGTDSFAKGPSFDLRGLTISDIAGGDVIEGRPEEFIVSYENTRVVAIVSGNEETEFEVGFTPIAVAAGDTNADGVDELVALNTTSVAVCDVAENKCSTVSLEGGEGLDLAVADVDADSRAEILVLKSTNVILAINLDHEETIQSERFTVATDAEISKIAAGDIDGDSRAEVIGLEDGGYFGDERLHVYHLATGASIKDGIWDSRQDDVIGLTIGDMDGDQKAELVLLRENNMVRSLEMVGTAQFSTLTESSLNGTTAQHIAVADYDGDSPLGKLISGPDLISGRPTPLFAAFYPPYWREYSTTPANVYVGDSDLNTVSETDMVTMKTGVELGVEFNLVGAFKAGLSTSIEKAVNRSQSRTDVTFVGNRVWTQAAPEIYGPHYGSVTVAYSCYHSYTYEMDDPADTTDGGDGGKFSLVVPVDGKTAVLSTMRFNALAKELGGLPIIEIPHTIGDPSTYPTQMETLSGDPIAPEKLLVPNPPSYEVSEIGFVGFWLALWKFQGMEESYSVDVNVKVSGSVPGFSGSARKGTTFFSAQRLEVGKETVFGGMLPTLIDDPSTPEDEFINNKYSFAPIVYRENYVDDDGVESGYFVFHYMVGQ